MSGSPKHTRIVPRTASQIAEQRRQEQQRQKHRMQIGQSQLLGYRSAERAAIGLLTAQARAQLEANLSRLRGIATHSGSVDQIRLQADLAADYAREIETIAQEAARRRAEHDALSAIARRRHDGFTDPGLRQLAQAETERAARVCAGLEKGDASSAEAHAECRAVERQWTMIQSAQATLTDMETLAQDLLKTGVNVSEEFDKLRANVRVDIAATSSHRSAFLQHVNHALDQISDRSAKQALELESRWGTIVARMDVIGRRAESVLRSAEALAPDETRAGRERLESLRAHVHQRGNAGAAEAFETKASELEEALSELQDRAEAAASKEAEAHERRQQAVARLTALLDSTVELLGEPLGDAIRRNIDEIRHVINSLIFADADGSVARHIETRIGSLLEEPADFVVAENTGAMLLNEIESILRGLQASQPIAWAEGSLDRLIRNLSQGKQAVLNGTAKDGIQISWHFSKAGEAIEVRTDDGEGPSCDAQRAFWRELAARDDLADVIVQDGEEGPVSAQEMLGIEPRQADDNVVKQREIQNQS